MLDGLIRDFDTHFELGLATKPTLLAVSGGLDSMVLAHCFLASGFPFSLAHVNFGLRGEESDGDERLVKDFAEKHNLRLFTDHPDTALFASQRGISIQMAARELRYGFFKKCRSENSISFLATAHHANDALENFFIYLLRGNNEAALKGITNVDKAILRPLAHIFRYEILQYARKNNITWREDSSNAKSDYLRNKIRNRIIPGLEHFYPEIADDYRELSQQYRSRKAKEQVFFESHLQHFQINSSDGSQLIENAITAEPSGLATFHWFLRKLGFHRNMINTIVQHPAVGSRFVTPGTSVFVEPNGYRIWPNENIPLVQSEAVYADALPLHVNAGVFELELTEVAEALELEEESTWYFDLSELQFPILLRKRNTGDKMKLWGSGGTKKVSDILVDAKLGVSVKDAYPVVDSPLGILGVVGLKRSDIAPVNKQSKNLLRIKWRKTGLEA